MKKIIGITVMLFISIAAFSQNSRGYNNHSGTNQGVYNNDNGQPGKQHNIDAGRAGELHGRTDRTHVNNQYHDRSVYTPQRRTTRWHRHYYTRRRY
jgi:hypothetical protein